MLDDFLQEFIGYNRIQDTMVMLVILTWVYMFGLWYFWMQFNAGCATEGCKPVGKSCFLMQRTLALSFRRMIYLR
jgi:hypothetical protein